MPQAVFTPTNIFQGPGNLWLSCNVPAAGARLLIDANGNPTEGSPRHVGGTDGAMTIAVSPKFEEMGIDQETDAVDVIMTAQASEIDVTMKELTFYNLRDSLGVGIYASGTDTGLPAGAQQYEELSYGGLMSVPKFCVAVIAQRRDAPGKFVVSVLYNAYAAGPGFKLDIEKGKPTLIKQKFKGLAISSRAAGDKTGKIYRQV